VRIIFFAPLVFLAACSTPAKKPEPIVYFKADQSTAGSVNGRVLFTGNKPARIAVNMDADADCAAMHKTGAFDESLVVSPGGGVANVFVYIKQGLEGKKFEPVSTPVVIDQRGCWFYARVSGIQTGQTLNVTNSDPVTHNIHPVAVENREWNQSQAQGAPPLVRRFARPEIMIPVKCNIHSWMHAYIGVVDHPYFAVTGPDGTFEIKNLPPGDYTIEAWQEKLGKQEQRVTVSPSAKREITYTFKD
jgi:plastocyanin